MIHIPCSQFSLFYGLIWLRFSQLILLIIIYTLPFIQLTASPMALRGADIDPDALRAGGVVIYLNSFQRTRAWVGSDELSYAPGELVRGTAYLKNSPHHARRQLVLSQVDVYLSPECVRRKINNTYETKEIYAKKQNLTEIYYTRRGGPRHNSYKSYYNYGETVRFAGLSVMQRNKSN